MSSLVHPSSSSTNKTIPTIKHTKDQIPALRVKKPQHLVRKPFIDTILDPQMKQISQSAQEFWEMDQNGAIEYLEKKLAAALNEISSSSNSVNDIKYEVSVAKVAEQLATMYYATESYEKALNLFSELKDKYYSYRKYILQKNPNEQVPEENYEQEEELIENDSFAIVATNFSDCLIGLGREKEGRQALLDALDLCNFGHEGLQSGPITEKLAYMALQDSKAKHLDLSQKMQILKDAIELIDSREKDTQNCDVLYAKGILFEELAKILPVTRVTEREQYLDSAVQLYKKMLQIDPTQYHAMMNAGDCCCKLGKDSEGLSYYNLFIDNFDEIIKDSASKTKRLDYFAMYVDIIVKLGIAYTKFEDYDMAIKQFGICISFIDKVLKHNSAPNATTLRSYKVAALNKRGICFLRKHEYWKCVNDNSDAINIDNTYFPAFRDRAAAYESLGKLDLAKEDKVQCEYLKRKFAISTTF
ncbi:hypothetical protein C9374_007255 [Naegleria lovaniensis]|uniref:Uncharacterized protein n=1 Tax=Naegleria lovaniensis TaxID=51637 RepID=A0AA88H556_NAELO|nr:uncharacterized protein C9374_007255 [Naegleria lovaniensis]KAG2393724.1 hypothetical protein C9374_007255 [Naegleria lovaniensis]